MRLVPRRGEGTSTGSRAGRRLPTILVAAALAGAAALVPAATAEPLPPGLTLALQDDHLAVVPEAGVDGRLALLGEAGVRVTRVDVFWDQVAPTRPAAPADPNDPAYRWSRYDRIVDGLGARGVAVMFNVFRSPRWSNGGRSVQWAPAAADFGAFMTALARRYDGATRDRAGAAHGPVALYQAWNEPNFARFLMPQWRGERGRYVPASPGIYAGLLAQAYAAVKAVQPAAWVVAAGGGPNNSDFPPSGGVGILTFIRELARYAPPADAFAQHLYPADAPSVTTAMPSFRTLGQLIAEYDRVRPGLPFLITEFGWSTAPSPFRSGPPVTEAQQAAFLREAVAALAAMPRVRLAVWFNLQDHPEWTSGLRRPDLSPKPSWDVFRSLVGVPPRPRGVAPAPRGGRREGPRPPRTLAGRLRAEQRVAQRALRRLAAVELWLDQGIASGDLRDGGLGRGRFGASVALAGEGVPRGDGVAAPRPLPVVATRPPRGGRVRGTRVQMMVNRRIARAALRRAAALGRRLDGRLTGGDLHHGAVTAAKLAPGLSVASLALPAPDPPRSRTVLAPAARRPAPPPRATAAQLRANRRLARAADRAARRLERTVTAGLTGEHFRAGSIGAAALAEDLRAQAGPG